MNIKYVFLLITSLGINDLVSIEYNPVIEKIKSGTYFERLKNLIDKLSKQNDSDSSFCKVTMSNDQAKVAVVSGYFRPKVYLCDVSSEKITTILKKTKHITKLGFSPDSKKLVTCDKDGLMRVFDSENGNHLVSIKTGFETFGSHCFIFSASSNKIIFASGKDISVFDMNTGQLLYTLIGHTSWVRSLVLTSDDSLLASVAERDRIVYLWDMRTGKLKYTLQGEKDFFSGFDSLAVNNDDSSIAAGTNGGTIYVWNLKTRKLLNTFSQGSSGVDSLIFTKDNSKLISGSSNATVCIWDLKTNKKENVFKLSGVAEYMRYMFLSEKEDKLITLHGSVINIWDIKSNKTLALNTLGALNFYELYVHNNIIIGSSDKSRIYLWNLNDIPMSSFYTIASINPPIAEKNSTSMEYYGKNINELRAQDPDLDKAVREAFWDTKYVSFLSYFTSRLPQDRVKRMQKNLPIIEKIIEVLKKQITSNEGAGESTGIDSNFARQTPNEIMSLLMLIPWLVIGELIHSHIKAQAKKRLNVSKNALNYLYKVQESLLQALDICDRYGKDVKVLK